MKLIALLTTILTLNVYALEIKQNPYNLNVAISVTEHIVEYQLETPMDLVLGFTKKPETKAQIAQWSKVQSLWFNQQKELFIIDGVKCVEEESSIEYDIEEELTYGEVLAKVILKCNKSLENIDVTVKLKEKFPKVRAIDMTIFPNAGNPKTHVLTKKIEKITL